MLVQVRSPEAWRSAVIICCRWWHNGRAPGGLDHIEVHWWPITHMVGVGAQAGAFQHRTTQVAFGKLVARCKEVSILVTNGQKSLAKVEQS